MVVRLICPRNGQKSSRPRRPRSCAGTVTWPPASERVIGALRREFLNRLLILGERHLALVLRGYLIHYNGAQATSVPAPAAAGIETQPVGDVADLRSARRKPVAGAVNEYHHAA